MMMNNKIVIYHKPFKQKMEVEDYVLLIIVNLLFNLKEKRNYTFIQRMKMTHILIKPKIYQFIQVVITVKIRLVFGSFLNNISNLNLCL